MGIEFAHSVFRLYNPAVLSFGEALQGARSAWSCLWEVTTSCITPVHPTLNCAKVKVDRSSGGPIIVCCRILSRRYWPLQENLWSLQEWRWVTVYCKNHGCCRIFMVSGGNLQPLQENNSRCRNSSQLSQNAVLCRKNFNFTNISRFFIFKAYLRLQFKHETLGKHCYIKSHVPHKVWMA